MRLYRWGLEKLWGEYVVPVESGKLLMDGLLDKWPHMLWHVNVVTGEIKGHPMGRPKLYRDYWPVIGKVVGVCRAGSAPRTMLCTVRLNEQGRQYVRRKQ